MILYDLNLFTSNDSWFKNREKTLFKNKEALEYYQKIKLKNICNIHKLEYENCKEINELPKSFRKDIDSIKLRTSGSRSKKDREYLFSKENYYLIECHHLWRICHEHNISYDYGSILSMQYAVAIENNRTKWLKMRKKKPSFGFHKDQYILRYTRDINKDDIIDFINEAKNASIVFLQPSQLDLIKFLLQDSLKVNTPIILTGENLYKHTEDYAISMFSKVINKMRCWDGGLSFYTCKYNRKHINDDLCYTEVTNNNYILSTDFYNYATPFIKYNNNDRGIISEGLCDCGIYSKYFTSFEGSSSSVLKLNDKFVDGGSIVGEINEFTMGYMEKTFYKSFYEKYKNNFDLIKKNIIFHIQQLKNEDINFIYQIKDEKPSEEYQKILYDGLCFIFFRKCNENLSSDFMIKNQDTPKLNLIYNSNLWHEGMKGIRYKFNCIETELIKF